MRLFETMKSRGLKWLMLAGFAASILGCAPDASTPAKPAGAVKTSPQNQAGSTESLDPTGN